MVRCLHLVYLLAVYSLLMPARAAPEPAPRPLRWSWWGELERISYDEPGVMQERGVLYGLAAAVEQDIDELWAWRLEGSWVYGRIDYHGAVVNVLTGEEVRADVETPNTILNARVLAARRFAHDGRSFRPYTGLGYRLLIDDLPGDAGYTREQTYFYIPIGVEADAWSPSEWKTGFRLEFDWLIRGHNDSRTDVGFVDASVTQDSGYGLQLAFTILREFAGTGRHNQPLRLTLEPFVQYWDIARSDSDIDDIALVVDGRVLTGEVTYFEPRNTTDIYGIRASLEF